MTKGLDPDDPRTTEARREIVSSKPFLSALYNEWYDLMVDRLPEGDGSVLELGSGGGFFSDRHAGVITSEILQLPGVDLICDARRLPLISDSLKAIVMTNVFHHIPDAELFLDEAVRCLHPGGRLVMIEPWNTAWSRLAHATFHDERMDIHADDWQFESTGPVSGANAALPWIVFHRDRTRLEARWPALVVLEITPMMPLTYLLSGGVSRVSFQPQRTYNAWRAMERRTKIERVMAIFALIVVERQ